MTPARLTAAPRYHPPPPTPRKDTTWLGFPAETAEAGSSRPAAPARRAGALRAAAAGERMTAGVVRTARRGATRAVAPTALATVGGLAATRVIERTAYSLARGTFGTNTGPGSLTGAQRMARVLFTGSAAVVTAGALAASPNALTRGAAVGATAGFTWHLLNNLGINV